VKPLQGFVLRETLAADRSIARDVDELQRVRTSLSAVVVDLDTAKRTGPIIVDGRAPQRAGFIRCRGRHESPPPIVAHS